MSARAWRLAIVALILGLAALRLVNLQADPPTYLDLSGGSFADEGPWLHNARNLLKYGTLRTDGWNPMLLSPLTHLTGLASMALFGVGLAEARISAAVVFLGILIGVAAWPGDRRTGAVMVVLFGSSYIAGMFGRLVLVDNMVLLLAVGTAALICAAPRWNRGTRIGLALAGVLGALCLITKVLVVFLVPAWYAAILVAVPPGPTRWREWGLRIAGFSLALCGTWLVYLVYVRWPNAEEMAVYLRFYESQQALTWSSVAKNIILQRFFAYLSWSAPLLVLFLWSFYGRVSELLRKREWPGSDEMLAMLWFAGGFALLSMLRYRPMRYYLVLLPPMVYVVAQKLRRLSSGEELGVPGPMWGLRSLMLIPALTGLGLLIDGAFFDHRLSGAQGGMGISTWRLGVLVVLSAVAAILPGVVGRIRGPVGATALMGLCLIHEGVGMLSWILQPEYTIERSSEDLARRIPSNAIVTGQFAIQLTFDTELRAVPVWGGYYNSDRPFERYGISHLLLWDYNDKMEIRNFEEHFPEAMARARPVHRYWIKRSNVVLYELESAGSGRTEGVPGHPESRTR